MFGPKISQKTNTHLIDYYGKLTLNDIINSWLVPYYPEILAELGFNSDQIRNTLQSVDEYFDGNPSGSWLGWNYPGFFETSAVSKAKGFTGEQVIQEHLRSRIGPAVSVESKDLTDARLVGLTKTALREKYSEGHKLLARFDDLLNYHLNDNAPTYYIFVSNKLDFVSALADIQNSMGHLSQRGSREDQSAALIEGTSGYGLYQKLLGKKNVRSPLEKSLQKEVTNQVIAVSPSAKIAPVRVHRVKGPESFFFKEGYSTLCFLLLNSYGQFRNIQSKKSRGIKYLNYGKVGVGDSFGGMGFMENAERLPAIFSTYGLQSILHLANYDPIQTTGEIHWDVTIGNIPQAIECHVFSRIDDYLRAQLLGKNAWQVWKNSRTQELKDLFPLSKKGRVQNALDLIKDYVRDLLRVDIPYYPGEYYLINESHLDVPIVSLSQRTNTHNLQGVYTLYNSFPWTG